MLILGIESTCDETSAAIVRDGRTILCQKTCSSIDVHEQYGGVFPELACRRHIDAILPVIAAVMTESGISPADLDAIAVAQGPGLIGALLIGLHAAKGLAIAWNKPLIGVNHVEAHLYASMMKELPPLPALGLVLSGGHTLMLSVSSIGEYELLGTTVDDAIGEAFDKAALLFGLPYPGGAALEKLALTGTAGRYRFSPPKVKKNPLYFSFSGLKTAVLEETKNAVPSDYPDIAAAFQKSAFEDIANKAHKAIKDRDCRSMLFGGGVSNNTYLRSLFSQKFPHLPLFWPMPGLSSDNAAMIGGLAFHKTPHSLDLEASPRLSFWSQL